MNLLYLDTFSGISGDMVLGLLVDLGADLSAIEAQLRKLPVSGYRIDCRRELRTGITGSRVEVLCEEQEHHRTWADIDAMLAGSALAPPERELARRIFRRIGEAEAKVHGVPLERVHFHEVGALDSIVDVVGAAVGLYLLGAPKVVCSPLPLSRGRVRTAHGEFPLPAPATVEILRGCPVVDGDSNFELVTPTGAAIAAEFASFGPIPAMTVERVGYGVGGRHLEDRPNLLRGILAAETDWPEAERDRVAVLESHLDDANPEWLGDLLERLLGAGALDAGFTALQMKKNRPGVKVTVVAPPEKAARLSRLLLRESSASGVRVHESARFKLGRKAATVATALGQASVKLLYDGEELLRITPEYEDCRRLAEGSGRPLPEVYRLVERAAQDLFQNG
ncbi:MAG: TIGR00299 family protein [Desulfuromonas sp.]|uniref:nickel pincer cofactor biosynthesis protein LarC n=1 Tax=Desulfuromonas sp. TaxID=892 RepID=UPI000CB7C362|nr:nickel pincer cofactor biosynthesis protein LarC [Desulfuromonas sp.]PLX86287.1 MAG: TIGR00299 family protein [Desulfuromonas sp.]